MNVVRRIAQFEFARFAVIGTIAFVVDTLALYAALAIGFGFYAGRALSFFLAVTFTWYGNRHITFADSRAHGAAAVAAEWLKFVSANLVGGAANYSTYVVLIANVGVVRAFPVLGVAAGSLVGLTLNFTLSKLVVFRAKPRS